MFNVVEDWTTSFVVDGQVVGGDVPLVDDPRVIWCLETIGGATGQRALELGSFEGAHTKTLIDQGAAHVTGIEGLRTAWIRSLVIKEIYEMHTATLMYGDFCAYVADYEGPPYDFVLASGVLYHQRNPAQLIHDLARLTDRVLIWAQVADDVAPEGAEASVRVGHHSYRGRMHDYSGARDSDRRFCGGLYGDAIWLYPEALFAALRDAGFEFVVRHPDRPTVHGAAVLFAASKRDELRTPDWILEP